MTCEIRFDDETGDQLSYLAARQRATIFDAIERQARHAPTVQPRNRKRMRADKPGFIAPWELRVGKGLNVRPMADPLP